MSFKEKIQGLLDDELDELQFESWDGSRDFESKYKRLRNINPNCLSDIEQGKVSNSFLYKDFKYKKKEFKIICVCVFDSSLYFKFIIHNITDNKVNEVNILEKKDEELSLEDYLLEVALDNPNSFR